MEVVSVVQTLRRDGYLDEYEGRGPRARNGGEDSKDIISSISNP